jgi:hypothetical protein
VVVASSPFYTSGTFWAGAGTVVGVVSVVAIVWVTLRVANPKRRLWYSMSTVTPLVLRRTDLSRDLRILYGDDQLQSPHTANIQLVSRGRLDIPRSAFDGDEPLQLDVSAQIVEILNVATSPDRANPPVEYAGSKLFVGPCLIGRREKVVVSLLIEGDPELHPLPQSLENVDIRPGDPELDRARLRQTLTGAAGLATGAAASVIVNLLTSKL